MPGEKPQKSLGRAARIESRIEIIKFRISATLALIDGNRVTGYVVQIKDISRTGIGIYSKIEVDEGTEVRISVDGLDGQSMDGEITWCGEAKFDPAAPPNHDYRVGINFTPKDDRAREAQLVSFRHLAKIAGVAV